VTDLLPSDCRNSHSSLPAGVLILRNKLHIATPTLWYWCVVLQHKICMPIRT